MLHLRSTAALAALFGLAHLNSLPQVQAQRSKNRINKHLNKPAAREGNLYAALQTFDRTPSKGPMNGAKERARRLKQMQRQAAKQDDYEGI